MAAQKTKIIRDVLYGFVELDAQEYEIVNSACFQRLRRIKQLSLTDMIYPGAVHTRFEHSIGVMQMASDMFDVISKKYEPLLFDKYSIDKNGLARTRKIIRLAALLHDVGHAPFSHAAEGLFPFREGEESNRYKHEDYSISIIENKLPDLINNHPNSQNHGISIGDVTALLGSLNNSLKLDAQTAPSLFWKALISGPIDADRADYLLRDSYHLGVKYGEFDRSRLVQFMAVAETEGGSLCLAIDEKGWMTAESLVLARYYMFAQVYFHKVRRIYDHHLEEAIKEVLRQNEEPDNCFPSPEKIDEYLSYDDWSIYSNINNGKCKTHGIIIKERKHYKCLHDVGSPYDPKLLETKKKFEDSGYFYWLDNGAATAWYRADNDIQILNRLHKTKPLSEQSTLIKQLIEHPNNAANIRFYADRSKV